MSLSSLSSELLDAESSDWEVSLSASKIKVDFLRDFFLDFFLCLCGCFLVLEAPVSSENSLEEYAVISVASLLLFFCFLWDFFFCFFLWDFFDFLCLWDSWVDDFTWGDVFFPLAISCWSLIKKRNCFTIENKKCIYTLIFWILGRKFRLQQLWYRVMMRLYHSHWVFVSSSLKWKILICHTELLCEILHINQRKAKF